VITNALWRKTTLTVGLPQIPVHPAQDALEPLAGAGVALLDGLLAQASQVRYLAVSVAFHLLYEYEALEICSSRMRSSIFSVGR